MAKKERTIRDVQALKKPRNKSLPGLEHARFEDLDACCESIAESRERKNSAAQQEKSDVQSALEAMQSHRVKVYKHAGVELILVPGDAKLRVRLIGDNEGEGADE